ncbi:MAG TPA: class I SAM-dependent methyltransferase [Flavisolibacter sp.]
MSPKEKDPYQVTSDSWNQVAQVYYEKFMDRDTYHDTYDLFCELVKQPRAKIFEIGCGPGNITKYLLSKRPDFQVTGIDVAENMVRLARKNNPTADFTVMDARNIGSITERFHGIVCGFCMPYLSKKDIEKLVTDCAQLLHMGGILYLSTMEGREESSGYVTGSTGHQVYMYFHQEAFIRQCLEAGSFEVLYLLWKHDPLNDGIPDMIFIAKKIS